MKNLFRFLLLGSAILLPQQAFGCTIPVFRYALEKWDLTPYDILVYHRGPLPADVQKALRKWSDATRKANLEITIIDLDSKVASALQKIWDREGVKAQSPWMLVRHRDAGPKDPSAWSGACTVANLQSVVDSPMRQTILKHLAAGSTVFLLLSSDDKAADNAAYALAEKELRSLEKLIKLPVQSEDGPKIRLPLPLKVTLPLLRLNRQDAQEAGLVRLLLATEDGLDKVKGPILFPIFGRGRVLGSLSEKELNAKQILEVTKFLCRECSCQLKELNPGIDLLMVADWNAIFDKMFDDAKSPPAKIEKKGKSLIAPPR